MFAAMGEEMLSVQYHAYDPAFPRSTPVLDGRWWMAGFHDDQKQAVWAFFVDQGATIPATLPRRWQGGLMKVLASMGLGETDAELIYAAAHLGKTRYGEEKDRKSTRLNSSH